MADGGQQRGSSSSGTRPQVEQLLGLRRDGADGGGGSGGGGGLSEESDSGEDNSVTRLWRRAFSGLKLAKDKATKKKKRSSMEDSEGIDPVYSLLKHAADRGTQKCAACCPQSESLSPAATKCHECQGQQIPPGAEQQQQGSVRDCSGCSGSGVWAASGRVASSVSGSDCGAKKA